MILLSFPWQLNVTLVLFICLSFQSFKLFPLFNSHRIIDSLQIFQNLMETLTLKRLSLTVTPSDTSDLWLYCIIKSDCIYCTKSAQANLQKKINLINPEHYVQISTPSTSTLFKIQIWDYDASVKIAETSINSAEMPKNKNMSEFCLTDTEYRAIRIQIEYLRKSNLNESSEKSKKEPLMRLNHNKSQSNLRSSERYMPGSSYLKKSSLKKSIEEEPQARKIPQYSPTAFGKWRYVNNKINYGNPESKLRL